MRAVRLIALVAMIVACRTPPPPPPEVKVAAPPPVDPLLLTDLAPKDQTLLGLSLILGGKIGAADVGRDLTWKAHIGETVLGEGTTVLRPDELGRFEVALPLVFGATAEALKPFQGDDTLEVMLDTSLPQGTQTLARSQAVRIRSPKIPTVEILSVQSSREGPQTVALTFLMSIRNPNPFEVRIASLRYTALVMEKTVADGSLPLAARVPASAENTFEIPAEATPANCGKDFAAMVKMTELPWKFVGGLKVGGIDVSIDLSGMMKLSQ